MPKTTEWPTRHSEYLPPRVGPGAELSDARLFLAEAADGLLLDAGRS